MTEILSHEAEFLSMSFYGSVVLIIIWETISPRRELSKPTWIRWFNNTALWLINCIILKGISTSIITAVSVVAVREQFGLMHFLPLNELFALIVGFVCLDLFAVLKHRLFHEIPLLWRFHQVHHSDLDCDVSTSLRLHPLDALVDYIIWTGMVISLGPSPLAVFCYTSFSQATNAFRHGNVNIPVPIDRVMRLLLVTPDVHRIHHSSIRRETNSNYGVIFSCWDRLMGTYCSESGHTQNDMVIGLEYFRGDKELWLPKILLQPFRKKSQEFNRILKTTV